MQIQVNPKTCFFYPSRNPQIFILPTKQYANNPLCQIILSTPPPLPTDGAAVGGKKSRQMRLKVAKNSIGIIICHIEDAGGG
jgi:hypothetical protein